MTRYEKITFDQFEETVQDHNSSLTDLRSPLQDLRYGGAGAVEAHETTDLGIVALAGTLNHTGYRQLCTRIGAPGPWLQTPKCPADLEHTVITRLLEGHEEQVLLRWKDDSLRAILSDKYLVYNHLDFWHDVRDAIVGTRMAELQPKIWKPSVGNTLDAWILFDGVVQPDIDSVQVYDNGGTGGLKPAIHISNGEDGTRSVKVQAGLFRSYCTNGVIFGFNQSSYLRAEHIGNSIAIMQPKVSLAIAEAAQQCGLGIDKFVEATNVRIKTDLLDKIVEDWTRRFSVTVELSDLWSKAVAQSQTWGDVVMATSDFAGTLADREAQTDFEEISGHMLFHQLSPVYIDGPAPAPAPARRGRPRSHANLA